MVARDVKSARCMRAVDSRAVQRSGRLVGVAGPNVCSQLVWSRESRSLLTFETSDGRAGK